MQDNFFDQIITSYAIAGSLILSIPVSTRPAKRCSKLVFPDKLTEASYPPDDTLDCTLTVTFFACSFGLMHRTMLIRIVHYRNGYRFIHSIHNDQLNITGHFFTRTFSYLQVTSTTASSRFLYNRGRNRSGHVL